LQQSSSHISISTICQTPSYFMRSLLFKPEEDLYVSIR
jgi:hypothetical protein